jgi:hypothetical protein
LGKQIVKEPLEEFPRPMRVGIGQGGTLGAASQAQMLEPAFTTLESVGNFAQRTGLRQLAEQHRHKLIPTGKPFGPMFGLAGADVPRKIGALKKGKNLAK